MNLNPLPIFSQRTLLVAFEGWNDAAEAATQSLKMIAEQIEADSVQAAWLLTSLADSTAHPARLHAHLPGEAARLTRMGRFT